MSKLFRDAIVLIGGAVVGVVGYKYLQDLNSKDRDTREPIPDEEIRRAIVEDGTPIGMNWKH